MEMNASWQPPADAQAPPPTSQPSPRKPWLPAAIIGSAILIAAGLIIGAMILKGDRSDTGTCQAWAETQQTLRSIPALPSNWDWQTPNIDIAIQNQNAPVAAALDTFEGEIIAKPADAAQAAKEYVAVRREQIRTLSDHSYTIANGAAVDAALANLDKVCGIQR